MDAIGDTAAGLQAYLDATSPEDESLLYLYTYGALQLLVVQQDALATLAEALDLSLSGRPELREIREVRNNAVGHPTKRGSGKGYASNFITRVSMTKNTFTLSTLGTDGRKSQHGTISIPALISTQRKAIEHHLTEIEASLEREDAAHVAAFADKPIRSTLPPSLSYHASKLVRFDPADIAWLLLEPNLEIVENALASVRRSLEERGLENAVPLLELHLQDGEYLSSRLRGYLKNPGSSPFQPRDMDMFSDHLRTLLKRILDLIDEIDADYRAHT